MRRGAFAEYVVASTAVARKPANLSFEEAAAVPLAALTALQGLRDHGQRAAGPARPRQRRLRRCRHLRGPDREGARRRGARGLQHAQRRAGACLGADRVFDYTREDFTRGGARYDIALRQRRQSLLALDATRARAARHGGARRRPAQARCSGRSATSSGSSWLSKLGARKAVFFIAKPNERRPHDAARPDRGRAGEARDRATLRARQIAEAMRAMDGHARAKIVLTVE